MLTRTELYHKIEALPGPMRRKAIAAVQAKYGGGAGRVPAERRAYVGDPWAYFHDVLGVEILTDQQSSALEAFTRHSRVLVPAGNNLGKTFLLAGWGLYRLDAVGALPDEHLGLPEQGARILLPGPDHPTVQATVYAEMLTHARAAELRGHAMPGRRSEDSVLWRVRPKWEVEAFSPPKRVGRQVAHSASGRHHRNQVALIEEGQGVDEALWKAVEGMCSSEGNQIVSSFNPTEPSGPTWQRARLPGWHVIHLDAFAHPNVKRRTYVIPSAVDYRVIDQRVATCQDRGPYPAVQPDDHHGDFVYALPPASDTPERGGRKDGAMGHPAGELHVYRPTPSVQAQVLGQWPQSIDTGLFNPGAWDAAVARWLERSDPPTSPDRVGFDPAREGADDAVATPAWGETAASLIRRHHEARNSGDQVALEELRNVHRLRVGMPRVLPPGRGPEMARRIHATYPHSAVVMDEGSVGSSPMDYLREALGRSDIHGVSFAGKPAEPLPGEPWTDMVRTQMYVVAAMLVDLGLVDLPDDPLLREEVMAHRTKIVRRSVEVVEGGRTVRRMVEAVGLEPKDKVKAKIGRSPDRSDAFVLAVYEPPASRRSGWGMMA